MLACEFWVHVGERPAIDPPERQAPRRHIFDPKWRAASVPTNPRWAPHLAVMRDIPGARAKVFAKLLICASEDLHFSLRTASSEGGGSGAKVQFLFADHTLDTDRRELVPGSAPIAVEPQVFDLLVHLMRNRDRVVSK